MLWPLGGIAFVDPPPRPGAVLWSIAAGPLVNVALIPLTVGLWLMGRSLGWQQQFPDLQQYLFMLMFLNGFSLGHQSAADLSAHVGKFCRLSLVRHWPSAKPHGCQHFWLIGGISIVRARTHF